jgi:hypothetical protein
VLKGSPKAAIAGERREMDCMDCHNRPSHTFAASAARAVDQAIANGHIDRSLPFVRREAVAVLKREYADRATALQGIDRTLRSHFRQSHPDVQAGRQSAVDEAVRTTQRLYEGNVFPSMRVTWGAYENNLGHTEAPGCFRCHDDEHEAADGSVIRQDCELCHTQE